MKPEPMSTQADRPTPINEFLEWLSQADFSVMTDRCSPESFGNQITILTRDVLAVRVIKDRSIWNVDIAGPHAPITEGGDFWFSIDVWQAYLDKTDPPTTAMLLDQEVGFVKDRWQDVETAFINDRELDAHLRLVRKEGAEARRRSRGT